MAVEGKMINIFGEMLDETLVIVGGGASAMIKMGDEEVFLGFFLCENMKKADGVEAARNTD